MNCLKCPNYWKTDIDEVQCDKCGTQEEANTSNEKESATNGNDVCKF